MTAKLYTAPSVEPVTLTEAKDQLSITDTVDDTVITRRIIEARQWAEEFCQRSFITQTWQEYLDAWPRNNVIDLTRGPVASVVSVTYIDTDGATQTVSSADYKLSTVGQTARLAPAYGVDWPSARDEMDSIIVRYTAGYGASGSSVPGPIREAIMLTVGHWIEHQPAIESGVRITKIPFAVEHLLQAYRVMGYR